jgi:hypothetical protein
VLPGGRPGRGGINRGRGDAALQFAGQTEGDTGAFQAQKLPRGRVPPKDWHLVGVTQASPEAAPVRDSTAGSAGATGSGRAAFRRRLAPHHREVVRRFFTKPEK